MKPAGPSDGAARFGIDKCLPRRAVDFETTLPCQVDLGAPLRRDRRRRIPAWLGGES